MFNLRDFNCSYNDIRIIPNSLGTLDRLNTFNCSNNVIKKIPIDIIKCKDLIYFSYSRNIIQYNTIIQRFIDRSYRKFIFHAPFQNSVKDSIICLLNDNTNLTDDEIKSQIIDNPYILCKKQLFIYIDCKDEHSILYCTFMDLFIKVYERIISNIHKEDLWKRLNEEMIESDCKCYTTRLTRLVKVLNGYYEDIKIDIPEEQ